MPSAITHLKFRKKPAKTLTQRERLLIDNLRCACTGPHYGDLDKIDVLLSIVKGWLSMRPTAEILPFEDPNHGLFLLGSKGREHV